ncbi:MAG: OmpH family outer membrane protein [Deltaproteobacteria bacterium]|jgi:Skp family chaperone for outer membrane proteins|nr:OmpH family outer membrane protein [Deltaproteobacteria bacterium]
MKKHILVPLALAALLSAFALGGCNGEKKNSLAIVDAEVVFQESKLASAGMRHLEGLTSDMQDRLVKMQEQLSAAPADKELEQRLQTELFTLQGNMDRAQRAVAEQVNKLFDDAVEQCRKEQGLDIVLPRQLAMAVNPDVDITAKVVALMDKASADFSDISLDKGAPVPAGSGEDSADAPAAPEE